MSSRQIAGPFFADCGIGRKDRVCYISSMRKARKARSGVLVPVVEEVPLLSDPGRQALRSSLDKARAEIAAGNYDVLTSAVLREEFDAGFGRGKGHKAGTASSRRPAAKRKRR